MQIIEFTATFGDVGRAEILRIFHPCYYTFFFSRLKWSILYQIFIENRKLLFNIPPLESQQVLLQVNLLSYFSQYRAPK